MKAQVSPFQLYNASAGSGKTFTIAKHYLSILLKAKRPDYFKHILAITFTNKAVAEMKERVLTSLIHFSQEQIPEKSGALFLEVEKSTGLSAEEIKEKSKLILTSILHNYAAFEISTIDGFMHRILRTFAKDLELSQNFEVELNTGDILAEAVDRVIEKAGSDKQLTDTLIDFALSKADDDKSWDITRDLNEIAQLIVNENHLEPLQTLQPYSLQQFKNFQQKLETGIKTLENEIVEIAESALELFEKKGLEEKDYSRGSIPKHFKKLSKKTFSYKTPKQKTNWENEIGTAPHYNKTQSADKKSVMDDIQIQVAQFYHKSYEKIATVEFYKSILKKLTSLSLINLINQEVEAIKSERQLLLISEFNKKISKHIANQPAPFIYERLGEKYQVYFVDEFQDTSQLQWQNLIPLVENSLASISNSGQSLGQLFLVGDAKQSIYRWRGGRAEQFIDLYEKKENPFPLQPEVHQLPDNFRSKEVVVNFNNQFFDFCSKHLQKETYQNLYETAGQNPKKGEGGYVNISFVEADNNEERDVVYPQKIVETLTGLKHQGTPLSDVCILVRKRKDGITIANYLNEQGIPIISAETLLVQNAPEVSFINNLLSYSQNPEDYSLKFLILDYLLSKENASSYHNKIKYYLELNQFNFLEELSEGFQFNQLQILPLYDAVEYMIRSFNLTEKADAYLQFYLDFVFEYTQKVNTGISGFLEHWELHKDRLSIIAPEGEDAVRIMTIHTSKGLEFPTVIFPYANQKLNDTGMDNLWVPLENEDPENLPLAYISASSKLEGFNEFTAALYQNLSEENEFDSLNILYVALTRAKDQLFIISDVKPGKAEKIEENYSKLLKGFLQSQNLWENGKLEYGFGELIKRETKESTVESTFLKIISTSPQKNNIQIVTKSGSLWGTPQQEAIDKGNLMHELLMNVNHSSEIEEAIKNAIHYDLLTEAEKEQFIEKLKQIVQHPTLARYFSDEFKSYNEKEIITSEGFKRIDRLCLKDKEAVILDYKTGTEKTADINQVKQYAQYLQSMGFLVQQSFLVYLYPTIQIKTITF